MALGIRPTVDFAFKKTFGDPANRVALISLLNALLQWSEPIREVEIENPFQYQDFQEDKLSILDIRARDASGVVFHIEMQVSAPPSMPKRLAYYAFELFNGQLGRGDPYRNLRPVFTICLMESSMWPSDPVAHHRFRMMDPSTGREYEKVLEIHLVELAKYTEREGDLAGASPAARWIYWLRHAQEYAACDLRRLFPEAGFRRAIDTLEEIAGRTEDREMYDSRLKAERDRQWLLEEALAEGLEKGLEQGLEKGLEQGLEKGLEQGLEKGLEQGLEQGLEKGLELGLEKGDLLGRIRQGRSLLGQPPLAEGEWRDKTLEELKEWAGRLEAELRRGRG